MSNYIHENNQYFSKLAKLYDPLTYILLPLRKRVANSVDLSSGAAILDMATGTGAQAYALARHGYRITGVDISPEMLQQAAKKQTPDLDLTFQVSDVTHLPMADNTFDASVISFGLHEMPRLAALQALKEMQRVTKRHGKLFIIDYVEPQNHIIARITQPLKLLYETSHYSKFVHSGLENLIHAADAQVEFQQVFLGLVQFISIINVKANEKT